MKHDMPLLNCCYWMLHCGAVWLVMSLSAVAQPPNVRRLAEFMSPKIRDLDWEKQSNKLRLQKLPRYEAHYNLRAGYHSAFTDKETTVQWVQIDLGSVMPIDSVALVPVSIVHESVLQAGYGFPIRFRVQGAIDPLFQQSSMIADSSTSDFENPGKYPVQFPGLNISARYIRVTATKLSRPAFSPCFALGELIVISNSRNVAAWRPVTSSSQIEAESRWSREYLVDEQSILPLMHGREASRSSGFLSKPCPTPDCEKWIELDLKQSYEIDEIRLIPAWPIDRADIPGWGIPDRFRIDLADNPEFKDSIPYCDFSQVDVRHGVNHALVLPAELREDFSRGHLAPTAGVREYFPSKRVTARYVRMTVTRLDRRESPSYLALAEFQVWSQGTNVALGSQVQASDAVGPEFGSRWAPKFLTDGYSSRWELLPIMDWLSQIERRRQVESALSLAEEGYQAELEEFWVQLQLAIAGLGLTLITLIAAFAWRQHRRHRQQTLMLRNQIASDLHDDIGSNLGTIALLCQTISPETAHSSVLDEGLREIRTIALETGDAMRDILWLMKESATGLDEFVGRLRTMTSRMTQGFDVQFVAPDAPPHYRISLSWRRNLFLSFKETLYNAVRHSKATVLNITVTITGHQFEVVVSDNGKGLTESVGMGFGRGNIQRRMEMLKGTVTFDSTAGQGTSVTLRAPLPKPRDV